MIGQVKNKKKFRFTVIERIEDSNRQPTNRIQLNFCPVFFNEEINRFYIKQNNIETIEELLLLSEQNVQNYRITESSVVDYAYIEGQETSGRVIWHYSTPEIEQKRKQKEKKKQTSAIKKNHTVRPLFRDKIISMIGGGNKGL